MSFRQAVCELVEDRVRQMTHPVQGYIPAGKIDHVNGIALEVKIPHPHGAVHPGKTAEERFIVLREVPLPAGQTGFIAALLDWVSGGDRAVTVGFKGASLSHPYIVNFLSLAKPVDDAPVETTANRQPVVAGRAARAGGSHTAATSTPATPTGTNGVALPAAPTAKSATPAGDSAAAGASSPPFSTNPGDLPAPGPNTPGHLWWIAHGGLPIGPSLSHDPGILAAWENQTIPNADQIAKISQVAAANAAFMRAQAGAVLQRQQANQLQKRG